MYGPGESEDSRGGRHGRSARPTELRRVRVRRRHASAASADFAGGTSASSGRTCHPVQLRDILPDIPNRAQGIRPLTQMERRRRRTFQVDVDANATVATSGEPCTETAEESRGHSPPSERRSHEQVLHLCFATEAFGGVAGDVASDGSLQERFAGPAATDCFLLGAEEALDDHRQHRIDGDRVVGGVRHDRELVWWPQ